MVEFEWDEAKRMSNIVKHRLDFYRARDLFDGRNVFEKLTDWTAEERFTRTGILDGRFVTVVWTPRNDKVRMISARRARDEEKWNYRQLHG